jgi:hypothetical protein
VLDRNTFMNCNENHALLGSRPDTQKPENFKCESTVVEDDGSVGYFSRKNIEDSVTGSPLFQRSICFISSATNLL